MTTVSINNTGLTRRDKSRAALTEFAKNRLFKLLAGLQRGRLIIEDDTNTYYFGEPAGSATLVAHMRVHQQSAYTDMLMGGSIGAAEAYMAGKWNASSLVDLTRLMAANLNVLGHMDTRGSRLQHIADRLYHWFNRNSEDRAKQNIAAHYDLSNEFFSLFLGRDMMYSAAVFPDPAASLEEASRYKLDLICRKLALNAKDHLLEIGTGWGGLAIHAAKHYGCRVTTTTISAQQYQYAVERVKEEGLQDRITLLEEDYRNLTGRYDKLVSIEMVEAVGHQYYEQYFRTCSGLIKPKGLMLLQAITIPDQRYQQALKSVDFIQRYIFPGGCLPSHEAIAGGVSRYTDMQIIGMQEIGIDYADTLKVWRQRFFDNLNQVKALGFDKTFLRMWEYYFCYCEGGFRERAIGTAQYVLAKPDWRPEEPEGDADGTA